jgi:N-acetylglucosaminyl-diphospho-decaprenol L-rhamnosyltransferase
MTELSLSPQANRRLGITVSIVSHGQAQLVRNLLACLDAFCAASIAKVIVIRNIPEDDALAGLGYRIPVEIITNHTPQGFGANHNQAFRRCETEWFLVLNPDISFHDDPMEPLLAHGAPDVGLLAPRIAEPGRRGPEPHRGLLTPLEVLLHQWRRPRIARQPEWVAGMFMLFRARAFAQLGGFDRRYFMYVEDADICARLRLAGWRLQCVDDVTVIHEAQRASRRRLRPLLWHLSSLIKWWASPQFWRSLASADRAR